MSFQSLYHVHIYPDYWAKDWEKEVYDVFNHAGRELADKANILYGEIEKWKNDLIYQINEHAQRQKTRLVEEYEKHKGDINSARQQFLSGCQKYDYNREEQQINQLITQCRALKFELGAFEFPEHSIPFIEFKTEEQLQPKNLSESKGETRNDSTIRPNSSKNVQNVPANNLDVHGNSYARQASGTFRQINPSSAGAMSQVPRDTRNSSNNASDHRSSISKCPVCFMIFPQRMSLIEQNQHKQDHYKDSV